MILDLLERLAQQQAAITAAQGALHRLVELGLDVQASTLPAAPGGQETACLECGERFPAQVTAGRTKIFCSAQCKTRHHKGRRKGEQGVDKLDLTDRCHVEVRSPPTRAPVDRPERPFRSPEREVERPEVAAILHPKLAIEAPA
jgi:hypothetical protein